MAGQVLPVQVGGDGAPVGLGPHAQVEGGRTGVEVSRRGGGVVEPLQEGFFQLRVSGGGDPVGTGPGAGAGTGAGAGSV